VSDCPNQARRFSPGPIEQVEWISNHIKDMVIAAPLGLMHITIFITGKRTAGEAPVLEGYVTDDRRSPFPVQDGIQTVLPVQKIDHGATVELRSGRPNFAELVEREIEATAYEAQVESLSRHRSC